MSRRHALAAAVALCLLPGMAALAETTPKRIRGAIDSLQGNTLSVTTADAQTVKVALAAGYTVGAIVPSTMDAIKPGTKVGIVGFGPPQHQRAAVVSLFPPGATVNEAQFAWDTQPGSVMTNAPVVSDVASASGRTLMVTVKGEPIEVTVPANAVIQETEPGTVSMLVPGAKVLIFAQLAADGTVSAPRVYVGKDGFTPAN